LKASPAKLVRIGNDRSRTNLKEATGANEKEVKARAGFRFKKKSMIFFQGRGVFSLVYPVKLSFWKSYAC
jgi:hypothetical protein